MRSKEDILPECPVATTVSLIGSKWKLLIMRNLLARPWRFNELQKSIDGISQKALTEALRSMEADGIVIRTAYPEVPPRVEYSLTELGESMRPSPSPRGVFADGTRRIYASDHQGNGELGNGVQGANELTDDYETNQHTFKRQE